MAVCQSDKVTLICVYTHPPFDQVQQLAMQSSVECRTIKMVSHH